MTTAPHPMSFFGHLRWIDGRPLVRTIEPYRADILTTALYTFDPDGRPTFNQVLCGRAKKNWKSTDLILAAFHRFFTGSSPHGVDGFLLANDEGQARDDLDLAKKLITANPVLAREVDVLADRIVRRDGAGALQILAAGNAVAKHGKTYLFVGFDEIHGYRSWDLFEALAPDPTRPDALTWITSYASLFNSKGAPLHDLIQAGKAGDDPRMFFSWFAADFCTDPSLEDASPEARANPSMASWADDGYLDQQRRRLPSHKYRRLHLNLPGAPDGAAFDGDAVMDAIVSGRRRLAPDPDVRYFAFVDMSGGSSDDAVLSIAHRDDQTDRAVVDLVEAQSGQAPFNPRKAVEKFAESQCLPEQQSQIHITDIARPLDPRLANKSTSTFSGTGSGGLVSSNKRS